MSHVFRTLVLGIAEVHLGQLDAAWAHTVEALEQLALVPPGERQDIGGIDPHVMVYSQGVTLRVHQGYLDQADAHTTEALEAAQRRGHPPTLAWAMSLARWRAFRRGDMVESIRLSGELLQMAERLGFQSRIASGQMMLGRALVAVGQVDEGAKLLRDGYRDWMGSGGTATGTEYAAHAADVLISAGRAAEAAEFVRAGEKVRIDTEERYYEPELLRLRGRLLERGVTVEAADGPADATPEDLYRRALEAAEAQGAKLFSLRAANDLARLLQAQRRGAEADAALRPVYRWFTEGFDYPELAAARTLLGPANAEHAVG